MASQPKSYAKKPSLHTVLIVPFVIQVLLLTVMVGYLSYRNGQRAVNTVAGRLRNEINARIEEHLKTLLETPHHINQINADALSQGWLPADDQDVLERYFWQQIQTFNSVTSIYFGNTDGGLVDAGREGPTGTLYTIVTDEFAQGPFHKYATDDLGDHTTELTTVPDFDARTRPWYTEAVRSEDATWGPIYILFTGQDMAISASRPVYDEQQQLLGVVSVDIFLSHLGDFLRSLDIGQTGQSFIMERSGLLIATSTGESPIVVPPGESAPQRLAAVDSSSPLIHATAHALSEHFDNYQAITGEEQFEFSLENRRQFVHVSPLSSKKNLDWLIVTVIPEAEFMEHIRANNRTTLLISTLAILITIGTGILGAQWIARPVARLNDAARSLAQGTWDCVPASDVPIDEIAQLADSFEHMAGQLQQTLESLKAEANVRQEAEAALRVNLEKYQVLFEAFPLGVTVTDQNGQILETNREAVRILGVSPEEHRKRRIDSPEWQIIRPDGTPMPVEDYASIRALHEERLVENVLMGVVKTDGQIVWLNVTAAPIPLEDYGVAVTYGDVTQLRLIEAEREQLIAELQTALERVNQLRGLLPICASCKKIRDDRGYWLQVETYIESHSEAEFSHGICPDCMAKLYPKTYAKLQPGCRKVMEILKQGEKTLLELSKATGFSLESILTYVQVLIEENQIGEVKTGDGTFYCARSPRTLDKQETEVEQ